MVKYRRQEERYKVRRIRAVLIETVDGAWAQRLRMLAAHPAVSGKTPSSLFWFTTSEVFTKALSATMNGKTVTSPTFLVHPERVFDKIWAPPTEDTLLSLHD